MLRVGRLVETMPATPYGEIAGIGSNRTNFIRCDGKRGEGAKVEARCSTAGNQGTVLCSKHLRHRHRYPIGPSGTVSRLGDRRTEIAGAGDRLRAGR